MSVINSKYKDLDVIRALATIMVVVIHVAGGVMNRIDYGTLPWHVSSIITATIRQCVPLFVMISGALLLNNVDNIMNFYYKRIKKIIIPLITWTFIYIFINIIIKRKHGIQVTFLYILKSIYIGEPYYILWYLYMIIGLYLATPFLSILLKNLTDRVNYILAITLMILSGIYGLEQCFYSGGFESFFIFKSLLYLGYYIFGFLIYKNKENIKINKKDIFLILTSIIMIVIGNIVLPKVNYFKVDYFQMYNSIPVLIAAIPTFKLLLKLNVKESNYKILEKISKNSMGIYLVHPIIILISSRIYYIFNFSSGLLIFIMIIDMAVCIYFSYIFSSILGRIPYFKKII